jgi:hypothetical protein
MKKILLLIATVVGALAIQRKLKNQQAEQDLWAAFRTIERWPAGSGQPANRSGT